MNHARTGKDEFVLNPESQPLVSVIMPTFNRGEAIRRSIDSVLEQTCPSWELIVVSDASTDDTESIVSSYADPRIRLLVLNERSGHPSKPRNEGIHDAQGQLIAYLDHDDAYEPCHLALALAAFEDGGTHIIALGAHYEAQEGRSLGQTSLLDMLWHPEIQSIGPLFQPTRVVHRKAVLDNVGGWDHSPVGLEDWELWLRMADHGYTIRTIHFPSTRIIMGDAQRSGSLPVKWTVPLGRLSTEEVLRVHHSLTSKETARVIEEINVDEATTWYRELWEAGNLVLPAYVDGTRTVTWEEISGLIKKNQRVSALPPLRAKPLDDGQYEIGIDLLVANQDHAERTYEVFSRRFPRKIAFLQSVFASVRGATVEDSE